MLEILLPCLFMLIGTFQVTLLMRNAHTPSASQTSNVVNLDKSIENMREQMELLEQQIDKVMHANLFHSSICIHNVIYNMIIY